MSLHTVDAHEWGIASINVLFHPICGWLEPTYDLVVVDNDECTKHDQYGADDIVSYKTNV